MKKLATITAIALVFVSAVQVLRTQYYSQIAQCGENLLCMKNVHSKQKVL